MLRCRSSIVRLSQTRIQANGMVFALGRQDVAFVLGVSVVPEDVEQLWTERVFVAIPDGHTPCVKDAIEWVDLVTA
jgi:hypothetical protein